jgi:hypothetical protein
VPADIAEAVGPDGDRDDPHLATRRLVAARCLHGADRGDAALELRNCRCGWSPWPRTGHSPSSLDHALRHGDSLVGLTSVDSLVAFHLEPARGTADFL